ncbi:hypothetical protein FBEOM_12811 [Fusarium beomiforme]|uniref:Uncharacterized protein n=1 Tax=Fusarium beomiforme TaxID=44412 RepID=A0A9P5A6V8_9HYPO|nr:hypothetical protein FBEOM_12811 [Fusarium beomiforme]
MPHASEIQGKSPLLFLPEHLISFLKKASFDGTDLEKIKEDALDNELLFLSEPRCDNEVLESVIRKGKFPFTLKGYFKFGFQPRLGWLASQTRDRNNGEQAAVSHFLEQCQSPKDTEDTIEILGLFFQGAYCVSGPSASVIYSRIRFDHLVESKLWRLFGPEPPRGTHRAVSQIEWMVAGIHTQFYGQSFGPYKGYGKRLRGHDYPGDMASVYKTKVCLLSNDYCTDKTEKEASNNLASAVEEVQNMLTFTGRLHLSEELEYESLFKLFSAVSCLVSGSYGKECEELAEKLGPRRHQLIVNDRFDPRVEWMKYTAGARILELQSDLGEMLREEAFEIWRRLVIERGDNRRWWAEQDKWVVPVEEVKTCLRAANPFAAEAMGL